MIIWIDKITRQFFKMDKEPTGEDLLNFDYKEIEDFEFEKLEKLKESKILIYDGKDFKEIDNEITREELIYNLKKELDKIKNDKIEKGIEIQPGIWHPVRDTDKTNLSIVSQMIGESSREWKCYDEEHNPVLINIDKTLINKIFSKGMELLNDLIIGEIYAFKILEGMNKEELETVNVEELYLQGIKDSKNVTTQN